MDQSIEEAQLLAGIIKKYGQCKKSAVNFDNVESLKDEGATIVKGIQNIDHKKYEAQMKKDYDLYNFQN